MRRIEAASAGTPARAQPAPPLIRLWRFPCPFQRRTAERYKGAAIPVLTLPCQDGTDSSNPLSSSKESAANLTSSIRAQQGAACPRNFTTLSSLAGDGCCGRAGDRRHGHRNNVQLGRFGRNRSNGWHYPGANSFARYSEEGNLLKPITWQFYHLSNT
jgi:hypothetical protein